MTSVALLRIAHSQPLLQDSLGGSAARRRSERVVVLLVVVVALSIVDLVITLGFMRTVGMFEANPVARHLAQWTGSTIAIAACKGLSVSIAVFLLHRLRRSVQAELGAWVAVAILTVLTVQWVRYANVVADLDVESMARHAASDPSWVILEQVPVVKVRLSSP